MFGLGFGEILFIAVIALLVLGPKKLPEAARTLGRTAGQFRRTLDDFHREVQFSEFRELDAESGSASPHELSDPASDENASADDKETNNEKH